MTSNCQKMRTNSNSSSSTTTQSNSSNNHRQQQQQLKLTKMSSSDNDLSTAITTSHQTVTTSSNGAPPSPPPPSTIRELYQQLEQKEKDLILAAELGKALLERNEELTRANERITEEYSAKLELLEQERHALKRKMDAQESEFESRIIELQSDLSMSRKQLEDHQTMSKSIEKEKSRMIQELMEQNARLTQELRKASESEDHVSHQLQSLREQINVRRTNLHDHVAQLEGLREEISILTKRKSDLEKRLSMLQDERSSLTMSLEEASERILMLEKKNSELEIVIRSQYQELDELRHANTQLHNKLDRSQLVRIGHNIYKLHNGSTRSTKSRRSDYSSNNSTSLFNEIEMSSSSSIEEELSKPFTSTGHSSDPDFGEEDIDICDPHPTFPNLPNSDLWKFRQEIVTSYQSLRALLRKLHHHHHRRKDVAMSNGSTNGSNSNSPDSGIDPSQTDDEVSSEQIVRVGLLSSVVREISTMFKDLFPDSKDGQLSTELCQWCRTLAIERNDLVKLRKDVKEKSDTIKKLQDEMNDLTKKATILEVELKAAIEERDNAKSIVETQGLPKDEIVKRAFELRDQAVARKNHVEIELAKTRIEVMHINGQLMETVQQKIELAQQLEQWQVDMQSLLDEQLKRKLEGESRKTMVNGLLNSPNGSSTVNTVMSSVISLKNRSAEYSNGLISNSKSKLLKLWR